MGLNADLYGVFDDTGALLGLKQGGVLPDKMLSDLLSGAGPLTPQQAATLALPLSESTSGAAGYVGQISASNFGVHGCSSPLNWGGVTGESAATRTGIGAEVAAATRPGNWLRIFLGFAGNGQGGTGIGPASGLFGGGNSTISAARLAEWQYAIQVSHAAGLRVLVVLEDTVPTDAAGMALYRDRLALLLRSLPSGADRQATFIDAIEPSNEVLQQGASPARIAELMRITATTFRALSPRTFVLSPSYQGGEAVGDNRVLTMLASSAAGVVVMGDGGGAGTTGEQFCDGIAFHPYIENLPTVAAARAALTSTVGQVRMREFLDPIRNAIAQRRAANPTYWSGRSDPEIWATEYNVNPNGGKATANSVFRMQAFSPAERARFIEQIVGACFASGVSKVFPYAPDHHFVLGPSSGPGGPLVCTAAPNGDLRINLPPVAANQILDGDLLFGSDGMGWAFAYNCTEDGQRADVRGVPATISPTPYHVTVYRWQMGGWAESYRAIQDRCIGYAEAGWVGSGAASQVQLRVDRGQLLRGVNGVFSPVAA